MIPPPESGEGDSPAPHFGHGRSGKPRRVASVAIARVLGPGSASGVTRARGRTEQFRPAPELMEFIGRPLLVGVNPDAVEAMPTAYASIKLPEDVMETDPDEIVILSIKCRREWRAWATGIARAERAALATLIDQLLAERARSRGLSDPPARGKD